MAFWSCCRVVWKRSNDGLKLWKFKWKSRHRMRNGRLPRQHRSELTCPSDRTYRCTWELSDPQARMGSVRKEGQVFTHGNLSTRARGRLNAFTCRTWLYEEEHGGREGWRTASNWRKACKLDRRNDTGHFKRRLHSEYDIRLQALKQWCKLRWMTWEEKRVRVRVCVW